MSEVTLTPEDIKNGWTLDALRAYHDERNAAAIVHGGAPVGGNIVTQFTKRYRPPITIQTALHHFSPHRW